MGFYYPSIVIYYKEAKIFNPKFEVVIHLCEVRRPGPFSTTDPETIKMRETINGGHLQEKNRPRGKVKQTWCENLGGNRAESTARKVWTLNYLFK